MDQIVKDFLVECYDGLDSLDRDLVTLETNPSAEEILASVFRTLHTIKGSCGYVGFSKLEAVAHAGENLLGVIREGNIPLNSDRITALLKMVDSIRTMLSNIEADENEGDEDFSDLIELLTLQLQEVTGTGLVGSQSRTEVKTEKSAQPEDAGQASKTVSESNIRVDVDLLNKLMDLAGELVLARNQVLQFAGEQEDTNFVATSQRLSLITSEMQEGIMKTRMQPIDTIWNKFPRLVRDLAMSSGKLVQLDVTGAETDMDRTLIEAMRDPLVHLLRNAVDHGIEVPDQRQAKGKTKQGRVSLRAYHEGGHVNIEIRDDGAGIDVEAVRRKAVDAALIGSEQSSRMSEHEALSLIFRPGFSTAERVTSISGRGVGMDVVKTNIEKIGGSIDVQSVVGAGTTFKIKIPLTLSIIPALIVTCAGERFAIPQVSLEGLVRLEGEQAQTGIELINGIPVYRLRGKLLPIVFLRDAFRMSAGAMADRKDEWGIESTKIVVLQADAGMFGLVVDEINDTEEIVIKPLWKNLKNLLVYSGASIMGDGRVALILDVVGLAQHAGVVGDVYEQILSEQVPEAESRASKLEPLLLLENDSKECQALPLDHVARLEKMPRTLVEQSGGKDVIRYREEILPLIYLPGVETRAGIAGHRSEPPATETDAEEMDVVVYRDQGRDVGFVVGHILDIVEEDLVVQHPVENANIRGTAIIQERVVDLLDVGRILDEQLRHVS